MHRGKGGPKPSQGSHLLEARHAVRDEHGVVAAGDEQRVGAGRRDDRGRAHVVRVRPARLQERPAMRAQRHAPEQRHLVEHVLSVSAHGHLKALPLISAQAAVHIYIYMWV